MLAITMQLKPMLMQVARRTCCRTQSCHVQGISMLRAVVDLGARLATEIFDEGRAYEALSSLLSIVSLAIGHGCASRCNEYAC
jgi:hypothetical protein